MLKWLSCILHLKERTQSAHIWGQGAAWTFVTLLSLLVAFHGTRFRRTVYISSNFGIPCLWRALMMCIVKFSSSNYNNSQCFLITTSFFGNKPSSNYLVMLCHGVCLNSFLTDEGVIIKTNIL